MAYQESGLGLFSQHKKSHPKGIWTQGQSLLRCRYLQAGNEATKSAPQHHIKLSSLEKFPEVYDSFRDSTNIPWAVPTTWELAGLMEPSQPSMNVGTFIPIFMDGISALFKVMEPITAEKIRSPVSRLPVHLHVTAASYFPCPTDQTLSRKCPCRGLL